MDYNVPIPENPKLFDTKRHAIGNECIRKVWDLFKIEPNQIFIEHLPCTKTRVVNKNWKQG